MTLIDIKGQNGKFKMNSCVCEQLNCQRETSKPQDSYAVMATLIKDGANVPQAVSALCSVLVLGGILAFLMQCAIHLKAV